VLKPVLMLSAFFCVMNVMTVLAQDIREYRARKISGEIIIDGYLRESEWTAADTTEHFAVLGQNNIPVKTHTWSKMVWDEEYLYIAFFCQDKNVYASYIDRDTPLYEEDVVEVFIDPDGDRENYIEVEVNPLNAIFDLWMTKPWAEGGKGNLNWDMVNMSTVSRVRGTLCNSSDKDTSWVCEMRLPFAEMAFCANSMNFPPKDGDTWRINLYRMDSKKRKDPNKEHSGWNQTYAKGHVPERFGRIIFSSSNSTNTGNDHSISPDRIKLDQNYPNPFNQSTVIRYYLHEPGIAQLSIFNLQGDEIEILRHEYSAPGEYELNWKAENLSTGLYFYRLKAGTCSEIKKCLLIK